jgi:uncharacterized surface protein with fasciclin (FAS1) repeats
VLSGCADLFGSNNNDDDSNLAETVTGTASLSSLETVISYVDENGSQSDSNDLAALLAGDGPFTVFAPSNDAFASTLDLDGDSDFDTDDVAALQSALGSSAATADALYLVVANHVVSGNVRSTALTQGQAVTTLAASSYPYGLNIDLSSGVKVRATFTEASVTTADVDAANGVAHIIDTVLLDDATVTALEGAGIDLGSTLTEIVASTSSLSSLLTVIQYIDSNGSQADSADLATLFGGTGPFTAFVPSNAAFDATLDLDGNGSFGSGDVSALESQLGSAQAAADALYPVVANHVTGSDEVLSTELVDGLSIETLAGSGSAYGLSVGIGSSVTSTPSDPDFAATVTTVDIQAINGVAHVIDTVLLDSATTSALGL